MKVVGIIPARYASSRYPGKPLVLVNGIPLIIRVAEICKQALGEKNTYIATDDERIKEIVEKNGFQVVMTSSNCLTGTDRVYEASLQIDADVYINLQGDEPMVDPRDIKRVADLKTEYSNEIINCYTRLNDNEDPYNKNIPKVAVAKNNNLIYMSRLPIPGYKKSIPADASFYKQVCIYAFNRYELEVFSSCNKKTPIEQAEDIEILRFLELGHTVKMLEVEKSSLAIDVPSDVQLVENALNKLNHG